MHVAPEVPSRSPGPAMPEPAAMEIVSAIVPLLHDDGAIAEVHRAYKTALAGENRQLEFLYVLDRRSHRALGALTALKRSGEPLTLIVLSRWDGEGAALRSGFERARGDAVLILPASPQVDPRDVPKVLERLADADMAVANRAVLRSSWADILQARLFRGLVRVLFGHNINDPVCRVRAYRRQVLEEIASYGVQQHFSPLLAAERGFQVAEVEVRPSPPPAGGPPSLRRSRPCCSSNPPRW